MGIEMTCKSTSTRTISSLNTEENNPSPEKDISAKHGTLKVHINIPTNHRTSKVKDLITTTAETQMQVETLSGATLLILKKGGTTVTQRPMTNSITKIMSQAPTSTYSQTDAYPVKTCKCLIISALKIA